MSKGIKLALKKLVFSEPICSFFCVWRRKKGIKLHIKQGIFFAEFYEYLHKTKLTLKV